MRSRGIHKIGQTNMRKSVHEKTIIFRGHFHHRAGASLLHALRGTRRPLPGDLCGAAWYISVGGEGDGKGKEVDG